MTTYSASRPNVSGNKIAAPAYHHGNLRRALIDATLELVSEQGVSSISVRELAKRVGVSPGAPFRHFANKKALLTAVAEEAMVGFSAAIESEVARATPGDELRAVGRGYLRWALGHRAQFEVISNRDELDFVQSTSLLSQSEAVMHKLDPLIVKLLGEKSPAEMAYARLVFRGFVYGLARMAVDRHLEEWNIPEEAQLETAERVLDSFLAMLRP